VNGKVTERGGHCIFFGTSPAFDWRNRLKLQKASVMIASLWN
jgi:hypothetical protein